MMSLQVALTREMAFIKQLEGYRANLKDMRDNDSLSPEQVERLNALIACINDILMIYRNIVQLYTENDGRFKGHDEELKELGDALDEAKKELNDKIDEVNNYLIAYINSLDFDSLYVIDGAWSGSIQPGETVPITLTHKGEPLVLSDLQASEADGQVPVVRINTGWGYEYLYLDYSDRTTYGGNNTAYLFTRIYGTVDAETGDVYGLDFQHVRIYLDNTPAVYWFDRFGVPDLTEIRRRLTSCEENLDLLNKCDYVYNLRFIPAATSITGQNSLVHEISANVETVTMGKLLQLRDYGRRAVVNFVVRQELLDVSTPHYRVYHLSELPLNGNYGDYVFSSDYEISGSNLVNYTITMHNDDTIDWKRNTITTSGITTVTL